MSTNLAVVFTEYQLLQTEAIVSHYQLKNVILVIHNKNGRIPEWLIDRSLFSEVIQLPVTETAGFYKLSKDYLEYYSSFVADLFKMSKIDILLGGQDENTVFALVKYYAKPREYWNIEDGSANYLKGNMRYKGQLFIKKALFSLYGYRKLDIRYGHGLSKYTKAFRLYPELSIGKKDAIHLGNVLSDYLKDKVEKIRPKVAWIDKYKQFDTLVVSELTLSAGIEKYSANELYKFHPEDKPSFENITYIKENIPLEFLPLLLGNIKTIRYQVPSSSILNMLVLNFNVKIQLDYLPPNRAFLFYTNNIIKKFSNRIEVLQ